MVVPVLVGGAVLGPLAAGLVYVDATRRGMQLSRRLSWTLGVGAVGFAPTDLREPRPDPVIELHEYFEEHTPRFLVLRAQKR